MRNNPEIASLAPLKRYPANGGEPALVPFLKWPGGKRWFAARHAGVFPSTFNCYIEPFLGSGSVFFHLRPERALLGDTNAELISSYRGIRSGWKNALALLRKHQARHGRKYYYSTRDKEPQTLAERAARLIYLNRTCFNGIYRVNREGRFNVPKGSRDSVLLATDDFAAVARLLRGAQIVVSDFEGLVDKARRGDLVFADPPYTVRHNFNAFIKYNERLFSWEDQRRLADALVRARYRGAHIVSTNANHKSVRELYRSYGFQLRAVSRFSAISADSLSRREFEELLILG